MQKNCNSRDGKSFLRSLGDVVFRVDWYFDGCQAKIDGLLIENNLSEYSL